MVDALIALAFMLQDLHSKFTPHVGQIAIGRAVFYEKAKKIFVSAGRSFGKSKIVSYIVVRNAKENPGSTNYIFLPFITQGREVYWTPKLLQQLLNEEDIQSINNTEMRIILKNGSQIKVCGADNVDSYRGVKPNPNSVIVFEECKDLKEEFITAFLPNLSVNDPILLMVGTPAEFEGVFSRFMHLAQTNPTWRYFHAPTSVNPHVSKEWLAEEKQRLTNDGEYETYLREYEAVYVKGGKRSVYPWILTATRHKLDDIIPKDLNKWRIVLSCDPASTSTFGVVFSFWNEYQKKLIVFDEIYEQTATEMTAKQMFKSIYKKLKPWRDKVRGIDWVYDEAAAWFRNEINQLSSKDFEGELDDDGEPYKFEDIWLSPSRKADFGVEGYIGLVRHVMNKGLLMVTDNCAKFFWEHEGYIKDENNRIPKVNDHLVNAFQYLCGFLGLDFTKKIEPKPLDIIERRAYGIHEDLGLNNEFQELD